eukprot:573616-Prorocentrum_minimum.AAC.1
MGVKKWWQKRKPATRALRMRDRLFMAHPVVPWRCAILSHRVVCTEENYPALAGGWSVSPRWAAGVPRELRDHRLT